MSNENNMQNVNSIIVNGVTFVRQEHHSQPFNIGSSNNTIKDNCANASECCNNCECMLDKDKINEDNEQTSHDLVEYLNHLLYIDPDTVDRIFSTKVECATNNFQNDPNIIVEESIHSSNGIATVLGLINGYLNYYNCPIISREVENGKIQSFSVEDSYTT